MTDLESQLAASQAALARCQREAAQSHAENGRLKQEIAKLRSQKASAELPAIRQHAELQRLAAQMPEVIW